MTKGDILRFLHAIQFQDNMEEIESICNKYEIRDITEFTHQRVSHKDDLEDGCARSLSMTGSY